MPVIECAKCGFKTNTACSNHLFPIRADGKANECYARWENERWSKGCSFDSADRMTQQIVSSLFKDKSGNGT